MCESSMRNTLPSPSVLSIDSPASTTSLCSWCTLVHKVGCGGCVREKRAACALCRYQDMTWHSVTKAVYANTKFSLKDITK